MPRRNKRERERRWYAQQPPALSPRPTTDAMALDLVKRGVSSPLILGPMHPRLGADLYRRNPSHNERGIA